MIRTNTEGLVIHEVIPGKLYQGCHRVVWPRNRGILFKLGIEQIAITAKLRRGTCTIPTIRFDTGNYDYLTPEEVEIFCEDVLKKKTFLHCSAGMNRSVFFSICCLILNGSSLAEALTQMMRIRWGKGLRLGEELSEEMIGNLTRFWRYYEESKDNCG